MLVGRGRELGSLRSTLDGLEATITTVSGPDGSGKTALVRHATKGFASIVHRCPPLPDPSQRAALAATLRGTLSALGRMVPEGDGEPPDWSDLMGQIRRAAPPGEPALVVVLDDVHRLSDSRSRLGPALTELMSACREGRHPVHVLLVGRPGQLPLDAQDDPAHVGLRLAPLTFRAALPFLPGAGATEKLEAYGVFGGLPGTLRHVDATASLGSNIRRLLLSSDGALAEAGTLVLERHLQTPSRYAAILAALSCGEAEWAAIHSGVSDLTTSGQVAPYLRRLEELELIEVRRSLDAKPRSRNRRYRISDPCLAFWYRLAVLMDWKDPVEDDTTGHPPIREAVQAQAASIFSEVCRQYMQYDVMERLGRNARECGGLWGAHYDMPVSGILASGAAFYGIALWSETANDTHLRALDRSLRETRYGFGRESRLRMLFTVKAPTAKLTRAAARRHDTFLVSAQDLAGMEAGA